MIDRQVLIGPEKVTQFMTQTLNLSNRRTKKLREKNNTNTIK